MTDELMCPACGYTGLAATEHSRVLEIPYGPSATILEKFHKCNACDFEGDIDGANDSIIEEALRENEAISVNLILDHLEAQGITMRYLERALRLPICITDKWKIGESISPEVIALLRIIRTYPGILEVSDGNFKAV